MHSSLRCYSGLGVLSVILLCLSAAPALAAEAPWESAYNAEPFAGGIIRSAYCDIVGLVEGSFGAMLLSAGILMAIAGAAFGDFTSAKGAVVVAVGAATIAAGVSLYFGDLGCGTGATTPQGNDNNPQRVINQDVFADTDPFGEP